MDRLPGLLANVREVIANPTGNLTAAVFLLAAAVVAVLMVLIVVMMVILPGRRPSGGRRHQAPGRRQGARVGSGEIEPAGRRSSYPAWLAGRSGIWVLWFVFGAVIVSGYIATSQDSYCVTCHATTAAAGAEDPDTAHESVRCVRCHEDGSAIPANVVLRIGDVATQMGLGRSQYSTTVPSSRCLSCHRRELDRISVNENTGVAMSHAEPLQAGWTCADCHSGGGHVPIDVVNGMSKCLACHDAELASAECETCHTKDTSAASGLAAGRIYGRATITRTDCEGCHSMESCDTCHGIRMPHSQEFLRTHPRYSGFDLKDMCFEKCHEPGDCGQCHGAWSSHPPSFKEQHKSFSKDSTCSTCHDRHEGPICDLCHDFNTEPAQ